MNILDIPISQAFEFCFKQPSYTNWLIGGVIAAVAIYFICRKQYNKTQEAIWGIVGWAIPILLLACVLLIRPCSVAANTSPEEAAKGIFIG